VPRYIDTHCHLDHHDDLSPTQQIERGRAAGVATMITVGTNMATSIHAVGMANQHDGVFAVVGVHPNDAMESTPHVLEVIDRLAREDAGVGGGETGLDYFRDHTDPEQQEASFRRHIDIARAHDRTLVIHCRDAWQECLDVLDDQGAPPRVVMHCFSGDEAVVDHCADRGWYLSFAGNVTFKNAGPLRTAAAHAPPHLLLTETDSPYLTPHPHRGKPNDPSYLPLVTAQLAALHDLDCAEFADVVEANARRAFGLPAVAAADDTA
jgi:TatD DNase family protein